MVQQALLALEDGTVFQGRSIGATGTSVGEVVFNTAMTGYQEILTDPSYAQQLVALTYPHVGNTGANSEDMESSRIFAAGLIIRDLPSQYSNFRAGESLDQFLARHDVAGISEIDTRKLTQLLRRTGAQKGCLQAGVVDASLAVESARRWSGLKGVDLAQRVTTRQPYDWKPPVDHQWTKSVTPESARFSVVAYDFGVKQNILQLLVERGCDVRVVPAQTLAQEVFEMRPDGVLLSNGPGDPEPCDYAIEAIQNIVARRIPVFGICLGHQLLALAGGGQTQKMKFGHHGANHPVLELATGRVFITSQNHGFTVDPQCLPENIRVTHHSLFDQSIQGIEFLDAPAFSFQGHPEASPGPNDITGLFDRFVDMMRSSRFSACA